MSDSLQTALIASVSALIGGLLASLSSWVLHRMEEKRALRQLRREKLEEIGEAVARSLLWTAQVSACRSSEALSSFSDSPDTRKAYSLACLYFPQLRDPLANYGNAQIAYYALLIEVFQAGSGSPVGTQATSHPEFDARANAINTKRLEVEDGIEEIAKHINDA